MGRTRFQKMIFLLQAMQNDMPPGLNSEFNFIPYDYGPYSRILQTDIDGLIEYGLMEEEPKENSLGKYMYRYEITEKGKTLVDKLLTGPEYEQYKLNESYKLLREIKDDINSKDLDLLLRDVYARYPEYAQFSKYEF